MELSLDQLKALRAQPVNARYMTAQQQQQLTENVSRDGTSTSTLLTYVDPEGDGTEEILSGHHRRDSCVGAGLGSPTIRITNHLSEERKRAIQLSHNAVVGQDDLSVLAQMYAGLDLGAKTYSGLDDSVLEGLKDIQLGGLGLSIKYQEMSLFFLAEDAEAVAAGLAKIEKAARAKRAYVARVADWDEFFALMVRAKAKFEVWNSGIAFRMLIDLAAEALDAMEDRDGA